MTETERKIAAVVVEGIKAALGPVVLQLAAAVASIAELDRKVKDLAARVDYNDQSRTDMAARMGDIEGDLGDVQGLAEAAAAALAAMGSGKGLLESVLARLAVLDAQAAAAAVLEGLPHGLAARLAAVEERATVPGPTGPEGPKGDPGRDGHDGVVGPDGLPGLDGRDGVQGLPGKDGTDGRDGTDGLGFEDLEVVPDGDRGVTFRFTRGGSEPKEFRIAFPVPVYRGVWREGPHVRGDAVTWAGSLWIAREDTADKPGDGATAWQLAVKAGRDGKEGKPGLTGKTGLPGPKGDPGRDYR